MCLTYNSKLRILKRVTDKVHLGWRVFIAADHRTLTTLNSRVAVETGKWISCDRLRSWAASEHPDGFYGLVEKKGTRSWTSRPHVVLRVKFRQVHTTGTSFGDRAFVAYEMFVPTAPAKRALDTLKRTKK